MVKALKLRTEKRLILRLNIIYRKRVNELEIGFL